MRQELMEQARDYGTTATEYGETALETVEDTVAGIPSNVLLTAAFVSIGISLTLKMIGHDRNAKFVGQWAPTFVGLAVFSKLAKRPRVSRR